jgi:hypothetical protein
MSAHRASGAVRSHSEGDVANYDATCDETGVPEK